MPFKVQTASEISHLETAWICVILTKKFGNKIFLKNFVVFFILNHHLGCYINPYCFRLNILLEDMGVFTLITSEAVFYFLECEYDFNCFIMKISTCPEDFVEN